AAAHPLSALVPPPLPAPLEPLATLTPRRDLTLPYILARLRTLEAALTQYSEQSGEKRRQAATDLHSVANARKAFSGQYQGLLDPKIMEQKKAAERQFLVRAAEAVALWRMLEGPKDPRLGTASDDIFNALEAIEAVQKRLRPFEKEYGLLETGHAFFSPLFGGARHCVRLADELPKKSPDRLREYRDSNLESLKFQLYSPAPLYPDLE